MADMDPITLAVIVFGILGFIISLTHIMRTIQLGRNNKILQDILAELKEIRKGLKK